MEQCALLLGHHSVQQHQNKSNGTDLIPALRVLFAALLLLGGAEGQRALEGEWFGFARLMSKLMWDWLPFSKECSGAKPLSTTVDDALDV